MPSCASIDPLVTPYIDGELGGAERAAVEQHIRFCPPCRSRIQAEQSVCRLLRTRQPELTAQRAPEQLHLRCRAVRASQPTGSARAGSSWRWIGRTPSLAAAAVLLLAAGGAIGYRATFGATQAIAAELTADHIKCLMLNAVMRTHDSVEDVEADLQSGFGWTARLPEHPEQADLELVGSRPCLYEHGKIAHIMYRHKGVPVSIFMLPATQERDGFLESLGHDAVVWSDAERTYVLIARAPRADVERVASFVQASLR
jgi:anti-sigma factor RsiW